ncbi:uncharacterized protein LOC106160797 [Lingula anatina]|uniref:Uncharacterized protein LOC106160797 n=1 Tax=Lingula anatina TaxID=7574 RepID=A0A1S3I407_LINAN|nr:uncharacterized protein LOC106160797 [Lingula anatina]|eukprot:XP_013393000.1 uncharacterized protein LOC106160797 [Lingula anatina]
MAAVAPVTAISWSEFIVDPPLMYGLFAPTPGRLTYDPNRVKFLQNTSSNGGQSNAEARLLHVETIDDLVQVREELFSKPLFMRVYTEHVKVEDYGLVRVRTRWRGDFAVLINTLHPQIRHQMEPKFEEAMNELSQGKKFCLEFDLGPTLERWYAEILDVDSGCSRSNTKSKYTRLYITNHTKYQHCFDCNVIWAVLCNVCWLMSAPCYMIHRASTVTDIMHDIASPIVMRTPLSRGRVVDIAPQTDSQALQQAQQALRQHAEQVRLQQEAEAQHRAQQMEPTQPPTYSEAVATSQQGQQYQPQQFGAPQTAQPVPLLPPPPPSGKLA